MVCLPARWCRPRPSWAAALPAAPRTAAAPAAQAQSVLVADISKTSANFLSIVFEREQMMLYDFVKYSRGMMG